MNEHSTIEAGVNEQPRDLANAADVLDAIRIREPKVPVQPMAHVVAVEHVGVHAALVQLALHDVRNGALARPREARKPENRRLVRVQPPARSLVDQQILAMNVRRATQART